MADKMTKGEFIDAVAEKSKMSKKDTKAVYEAIVEVVAEELKAKNKVALIGFGTFEMRRAAARKCRNMQTGEEFTVPAKDVPKFKFNGSFKDKLV